MILAIHLDLTSDHKYAVKVPTRDMTSKLAEESAALPNITLINGPTYDEVSLHSAMTNINLAFINTNGFAIGEKNEVY